MTDIFSHATVVRRFAETLEVRAMKNVLNVMMSLEGDKLRLVVERKRKSPPLELPEEFMGYEVVQREAIPYVAQSEPQTVHMSSRVMIGISITTVLLVALAVAGLFFP